MQINHSFGPEFDKLWSRLKSKYPEALFDIDGVGKQLDGCLFAREFFGNEVAADSSIDPNANVTDNSVIVYNTESDKPIKKLHSLYVLWDELKTLYGKHIADEIIEMQISGDIYIHDAHGIASGMPYCFNYTCYDLMNQGLSLVTKIDCLPPKYFTAFKSQLEQFTVVASNSTLGATGLADMLVCMSWYYKNMLETLSDEHFSFASKEDVKKYVKASLVSMIYTFNQPMRANQSPFTNVSIYDDEFLDALLPDYLFPDGTTPDKELVKELQVMFLDAMNEELRRNALTFPVTTACHAVDKDGNIKDKAFLKMIAEKNMEFAFINIYCGDSATISSCCRLRSEGKGKNEYFNSFGSGSTKIGSLGVCSINFPRLAYKYKDVDIFKAKLTEMVRVAAYVNNAKREVVKKRIDNGNEPLYSLGFMELDHQYSTCGVNGLNECVELLGYDICQEDGTNLVIELIDMINAENDKYQEMYHAPHNCEQVPGETMSIKMAKKDMLMQYNHGEYELYSNQFIPLTTNADMLDRLRLQGIFDKHFSGGSICHLNVENRVEEIEQMEDLIVASAKMGVIYFAINYNLQKCEHGHMSVANIHNTICPICGGKITDNYTRVVGFLTNSKNWHKVRRSKDRPNRVFYEGITHAKLTKKPTKKKDVIVVE